MKHTKKPCSHIPTGQESPTSRWPCWAKNLKMVVLVMCWLVCSVVLMTKNEKIVVMHQISVPARTTRGYLISEYPIQKQVSLKIEGALLPPYYGNLSKNWMSVYIQEVVIKRNPENISDLQLDDIVYVKNISDVWTVPLVSEDLIGVVPEVTQKHLFPLNITEQELGRSILKVKLKTNLHTMFPVSINYNIQPIDTNHGTIYAALVLLALYILIIFEIVHRTLAAMLASTMSVAILAALNERPTMSEIISWIDAETLLLLFSMMTLVAIFSETGIFDYMAVLAYKITSGHIWPLINTLCFFTAFLSCFLDNVTTVLLMTPVTIRLCEVMGLNPVPILMCMIIYSNIGGAITPVGDPPNVIIASNVDVVKAGVNFSSFTLHMGIGVLLSSVIVYFQLRYVFKDVNDLRFTEPQDVQELRREIAVWQRAAASLSSYSKDEDVVRETLMKRVQRMVQQLRNRITSGTGATCPNYRANLQEMQAKYPIRDIPLLIKSGITLLFVISVFFMHSIPSLSRLGLGWTALLGALLLLLLADRDDMEAVFARVEWSTLLFFASLFILMEALSRLGLIDWIGQQTQAIIMSVGPESRLAVAIILILWVSAFASAFVDNIPLATMMVRIITNLADNRELDLPLQPLVWALSFGACLGGNGTLFGASANVVCAGVAEQHGYRFTFIEFLKLGFPVMISSMMVVTVYMMVAHVALGWNA
ncbi:hoepel1 [Carabus blaptoides fortunei]